MLARDERRMGSYREAIRLAVKPDDIVLDVGCGLGILAMFACQAGAGHVYAVERTDVIGVARELAQANGFADQITFLHDDVRNIELPKPVDVIVSELISKAVVGQGMAELIGHCRDQFLRAGGIIIPHSARLMLAPVQSPERFTKLTFPSAAQYGLDFSLAEQMALNDTTSDKIKPDELLCPPQPTFHYEAATTEGPSLAGSAEFEFDTEATMHGFAAWFDAQLHESVTLDNHPPGITAWDNLYLPLPQPVAVAPGNRCSVQLSARDDADGTVLWRWRTSLTRSAAASASGATDEPQSFDQSTFFALPLTSERLGRPIP